MDGGKSGSGEKWASVLNQPFLVCFLSLWPLLFIDLYRRLWPLSISADAS